MTANANQAPYVLRDPFDLEDARDALRTSALHIRAAELAHEKAVKTAARAEADYRSQLAQRFVTHRSAGKGAGEADTLARGDCSEHSFKRDLAKGMERAALEALEDRRGDRASLHKLVEASLRAPGAVEPRQGADSSVIGGRKAA